MDCIAQISSSKNYIQLNLEGSIDNKRGSRNRQNKELGVGLNYTRIIMNGFGVNAFGGFSKGSSLSIDPWGGFFTDYHMYKYGAGVSYRLPPISNLQNLISVNYFTSSFASDSTHPLIPEYFCKAKGVQIDLKTLLQLYKKLYISFCIQYEIHKSEWSSIDIVFPEYHNWTTTYNSVSTNVGVTLVL